MADEEHVISSPYKMDHFVQLRMETDAVSERNWSDSFTAFTFSPRFKQIAALPRSTAQIDANKQLVQTQQSVKADSSLMEQTSGFFFFLFVCLASSHKQSGYWMKNPLVQSHPPGFTHRQPEWRQEVTVAMGPHLRKNLLTSEWLNCVMRKINIWPLTI